MTGAPSSLEDIAARLADDPVAIERIREDATRIAYDLALYGSAIYSDGTHKMTLSLEADGTIVTTLEPVQR